METKKFKPCVGTEIEVDTSDEACSKFGFRHGDRIKHSKVGPGMVAGVAPATTGFDLEPEVLWCLFDNGLLMYSFTNNIEKEI